MSEVLRVEGLGKHYGSREALRDVSFAAHSGEMLAVIGPNGAGKTTLLSILAGVQAPSAGKVGRAAGEIGWVPQQPAVYSKLSVVENLRLFARLEKVGDTEAAVARMLEQTGLAERADERIDRLSGGNQQRVNVALGLLADPPVILLDEPSSALDPAQRERLWLLVSELAAGGTGVVFRRTSSPRPSATRRACSCWTRAGCCSTERLGSWPARAAAGTSSGPSSRF